MTISACLRPLAALTLAACALAGPARALVLDDFTLAQSLAVPAGTDQTAPMTVGLFDRTIFGDGYGSAGGSVTIGGGVASFATGGSGLYAELKYDPIAGPIDLTGQSIDFDLIGETGSADFSLTLFLYEAGTFNSEIAVVDSFAFPYGGTSFSYSPTGAGIDLTQIARIQLSLNAEPGLTYQLGAAAVPLPAAGLLLGAGLAGLAGTRGLRGRTRRKG